MSGISPTARELTAIKELKALARRWPKSLWLFSANGSLCVMRGAPDGAHIHGPGSDTGIDPAYLLDTINISNDGGDW